MPFSPATPSHRHSCPPRGAFAFSCEIRAADGSTMGIRVPCRDRHTIQFRGRGIAARSIRVVRKVRSRCGRELCPRGGPKEAEPVGSLRHARERLEVVSGYPCEEIAGRNGPQSFWRGLVPGLAGRGMARHRPALRGSSGAERTRTGNSSKRGTGTPAPKRWAALLAGGGVARHDFGLENVGIPPRPGPCFGRPRRPITPLG
jgi:hypothetical protein